MPRIAESQPQPGSPKNPIALPREKKTLLRYYKGERLRSPMGGHLDVMGIREGSDGHGRVMLECNTSSLRYLLEIPKATRTEKARIKEAVDAGDDPTCPRHGPYQRLGRSGKNWVCPLCGVSYGRSD